MASNKDQGLKRRFDVKMDLYLGHSCKLFAFPLSHFTFHSVLRMNIMQAMYYLEKGWFENHNILWGLILICLLCQ